MEIKKYLQNSKGYSLVFVLILIAVLSITGVSIMSVTANNVKTSAVERDHQSVYYIAEAGVNYLITQVENNLLPLHEASSGKEDFFLKVKNYFVSNYNEISPVLLSTDVFESTFGKQPKAQIHIEELDTNKYKIVSIGEIDGRTRKAVMIFDIVWKENQGELPNVPISDYVIFTTGTITIQNDVKMEGYISSLEGVVYQYGNPKIKENNEVESTIDITENFKEFPNDYPEAGGNVIHQTELSTSTLGQIVGEKIYVVDNLTINSDINVKDNGSVVFYVKKKITHNNVKFNTKNHDVTIFYAGNEEFKLDKGEFTGKLFIKQANVLLDNGNPKFLNTFIYAPKSNITLTGGEFKGSIIAKTVFISGSNNVFQEFKRDELTPFFPDPDGSDTVTLPVTKIDLIEKSKVLESN